MATRAIILTVVFVTAAALTTGTALGASYTVGAPGGSWDLRTNYTQWIASSGATFRAGDRLLFSYSRAAHDVVEVSRADYDACSASTPLASFRTGSDVVPLADAGSRYFICSVPGHCDGGMKVRVNVVAATAPGGSSSSPTSIPARAPASAPASAVRSQEKPPSSSAASAGVGSVAGLGLSVVAAAGLVFFY